MSYASEVLADSPLAYWSLDDTSGSTAADASGNGRPSSYIGSPALGSTALINSGTSVTFTAAQAASCASASWMNVSNLTVECWANLTSSPDTGNGDAIVSRYDTGGFNWLLWRNTGAQWAVQLRNTAGTAYNVASGATVSLNTTYHLAFTFDGADLRLYVNGSQVNSTPVTGTVQTGTANLDINRYSSSSSTSPAGRIDEVAIYGTALSASRIAAHYTAATALGGSGSLSLSASGAASVQSTGSGSLSLAGSAAASGVAVGSGSLTLSGSAALGQPASGSGSLALSASGTAGSLSAASGSGSLSLSGSGVASVVGSGSATGFLTLSGSGAAEALHLTDTSNALSGRSRSGFGQVTLELPVAEAPLPSSVPVAMDIAIGLPTPVLQKGRPT